MMPNRCNLRITSRRPLALVSWKASSSSTSEISMSDDLNALIIAAVGVFGTLSASVVTQILSARTQRRVFEVQGKARREEYQHEQQEAALAIKRSCYIAMIANSRRYRLELMNYLYTVKSQAVSDSATAELEQARRSYSTSAAETELTAGLDVLTVIKAVDDILAGSFRSIKELERADSQADSSFKEIRITLARFWDLYPEMQRAMRQELLPADEWFTTPKSASGVTEDPPAQ
jgi:hypothetical protein